MRALSIHPEYAAEILDGVKTEEYRTWSTKHRGDLLICATAKKKKGYISGHALCIVSVVDVEELEDGTYAWILEDVRCIKPFPVKGQLGLYTVDDALIEEPSLEDTFLKDGERFVTEEFWKKHYAVLQH